MALQTFEEYDEDPTSFAYRIQNINYFKVTVRFPYMHGLLEGETLRRVVDRLYADAVNMITRSRFYSLHQIRQSQESDHVSLYYEDDIYQFMIDLYQDKLVFTKYGGKWKTFYAWYKAAVYELKSNVNSLMDLFKDISGRTIVPTRVSYSFRFIIFNMRPAEQQEAVKNSEIMKKVITKVPSDKGTVSDVIDAHIETSRMDYSVSVWHGVGAARYVLNYSLEAPANNGYSSVWYTFQYDTETYTDPQTGERSMAEPVQLLENYEAVFETLWKNGLNGFAKSLLGDVDFETAVSSIP